MNRQTMNNIPERDWKILRTLQDGAINCACGKILDKFEEILKERAENENEHKVYLQLWKIMKEKDQYIAIMFDDVKRSNAILKLAIWKRHGVISDEDFSAFSEETQQTIKTIINTMR